MGAANGTGREASASAERFRKRAADARASAFANAKLFEAAEGEEA
jgi:hypothetical protein